MNNPTTTVDLKVTSVELVPILNWRAVMAEGRKPQMTYHIKGINAQGETITLSRPAVMGDDGLPKPLPIARLKANGAVGSYSHSSLNVAKLSVDDEGVAICGGDGEVLVAEPLAEGWKPWHVTATLVNITGGATCQVTGLVKTPQKTQGFFSGVADTARFVIKQTTWEDAPVEKFVPLAAYTSFVRTMPDHKKMAARMQVLATRANRDGDGGNSVPTTQTVV
jgi:hypothetical protein